MSSPGAGASIEEIARAEVIALRYPILKIVPPKTGRRTCTTFNCQKIAEPTKYAIATKSRKDPEIATEASTCAETRTLNKNWFTDIATKMMFVSGETAEPSPETTTLIEEITRQQVIEIVSNDSCSLIFIH
jgi:hypothetical protein